MQTGDWWNRGWRRTASCFGGKSRQATVRFPTSLLFHENETCKWSMCQAFTEHFGKSTSFYVLTMEMTSPPKPTRIVNCLLPNTVEDEALESKGDEDFSEQNGELSLSSREILSLPALAGEVAVAQKQQINDLSKRQEVLEQLKVKCTRLHNFS